MKDWFGFQQQALPTGIKKMGHSTSAVLPRPHPLPSWKSYDHGLCGVWYAWQKETVGQWSWCNAVHVLLWLSNDNYLVVCYILLLVADKFVMTTCLADKCECLSLSASSQRIGDSNTCHSNTYSRFKVAFINWLGRWGIHLQDRILLEDCSQ